MIVYIPDPCPGVYGKLVTLSRPDLSRSVSQNYILVDIGLRAAVHGFSFSDYVRLITKVKAAPVEEVAAVVPDAFWNYFKTIEYYKKYAPRMARLGVKLVFVAQQLRPPPGGLEPPPDVVAVPARRQGNTLCSREPRLCAERIARLLTQIKHARVHLLGPPSRVLLALKPLIISSIYSFDTASYRLAHDAAAKRENGGAWMVKNREQACKWLEKWLSAISQFYSRDWWSIL